jgi:hypothetical protein
MIHLAGGPDPASLDRDSLRFLHDLRLSDETISHFELATTYHRPSGTSSPSRIHIPLHGTGGTDAGSASRAIHLSTTCNVCGEKIYASEMAARRARHCLTRDGVKGGKDPGECPRCGAPKKKASVSWLVGHYPKYMTDGGEDRYGKVLYNFHRAWHALDPGIGWDADDLGRMLIICEGFTDTWAVHEAGYGAVVSWTSARPTDRQLDDAAQLANHERDHGDVEALTWPILVLADSDEAGRLNAERAGRELRLRSNGPVVVAAPGDDVKDAAGHLRRYGARKLAQFIRDARVAEA